MIWRDPPEETHDYPKLVVHDGIASGSICPEGTGVGLWAISSTAIREPWSFVAKNWELNGLTQKDFADFVHNLLQQRSEFARLLCILADEERIERHRFWPERRGSRKRVLKQLKRCVEALEGKQ